MCKKSDWDTQYQQKVSSHHHPLSSGCIVTCSSYRHSENMTQNERQSCLCDAPNPTQVDPGRYLVRHKIIALQLTVALCRAEFYPFCTRTHVGSSNTGITNQTISCRAHTMTTTQASAIWACTHPERHTNFPVDPVTKNSLPFSTAKNGKPTSTNGASSSSGAPPTGMVH